MKRRFIAMLVASVMVLSMIPAMSLSVSAAVEGDWDTFRSAPSYTPPEDGSEHLYTPAGGYEYTSEGFVMIGADYSNTTPFNTVQTKEKQNLKEGVYMEFRIDEYDYSGPDNSADNWICVSLWNEKAPSPGNTKYGAGWSCLIRDNAGVGKAPTLESFNTVPYEEGVNNGAFNHLGSVNGNPCEMDNDREVYTLEVTHNGTNYDIKINGTSVSGSGATITNHLDGLDANGDFYVCVTMMSTIKGGKAAMSITKYGTDKASATTPVGSDSKEPEENPNQPPAPIADPSTVEANQPCIIYNADTVSKPGGGNLNITPMGDGSFHIQATQPAIFISLGPKRDVSYSAQDFPVIGALVRNCWASSGSVWYYSGDVMSANASYISPWSLWEGELFGEDEEYSFVTLDLTDMWAEGRINGMRLDFGGIDLANDSEFDICWIGHFRSAEEAAAYNQAWLTEKGVLSGDPGDEATDPTDEQTREPADEDTQGDTASVDTAAPDTEAVTVAATEEETEAEETGCASVVFGSAAILMAAAAAVVLRKKH